MKRPLTTEEALSILKPGDYVHCFRNPGVGMLIGADWSRKEATESIEKGPCELAGSLAMGMGHGLCVGTPGNYSFFETVDDPERTLCVNHPVTKEATP